MPMLSLLFVTLWLVPFAPRSGGIPQAAPCTLPSWLSGHPADSVLHLVSADRLDHEPASLGPTGPLPPPPVSTLRGIGAEVMVAMTMDSLGNLIATDPQATHISRYQGGVSPDEIRRWTPEYQAAAVQFLRAQHFWPPKSKGASVSALVCMTVHFTPTPVGKRFSVSVGATP
jgi:hypothetical protein